MSNEAPKVALENPFEDGVKVIQSVINDFRKIVSKLQRAIAACKAKCSKNQEKISALEVKNKEMVTAMLQAEKLIENLNKLIS